MIKITLKQAQALVEAFGGDEESTITVDACDEGYEGKGLYACMKDCHENGPIFLGASE